MSRFRTETAVRRPPNTIGALEKNLVIVERSTHDVGHVIGWTAFPGVFKGIKRLGRMLLGNPNDLSLRLRFYWASEFLILGNPRVRSEATSEFLSRSAWNSRRMSLTERFVRVAQEVNQASRTELYEYIHSKLLDRYTHWFIPVGGGQVQYGELDGLLRKDMPNFAENALRRLRNVPDPPQAISSLTIRLEQPNLFGDLLLALISKSAGTGNENEAEIRDLVARMEFFAGSLAELTPEQVIETFEMPVEQRRAATMTRIYGITLGEHSDLYRILNE